MLLPKWSTEGQKIDVPSISNQPWNILEEYATRIVDIVSTNCSSVQLEVTYKFHRDMPSVTTLAFIYFQGSEVVTETRTTPFNETQCASLIDLFMFDDTNSHTEPIVFEHLYSSRDFTHTQLSSSLLSY